jgi:hypothetical protein
MRADMFKVIVERPRRGKGDDAAADRRRKDFDGPVMLGMRAGHGRPWLNENLQPLRRYLHAQIGRPWNKVFSEICAVIDRRSTVQQHVHQHIDDFIATDVEWRDGQLVDLKDRRTSFHHRSGLRQPLYVDPDSGLIRRNKDYRSWAQEHRERRRKEEARVAANRRSISEKVMLVRLNDLWFMLELEVLPEWKTRETSDGTKNWRKPYAEPRFDLVLKRESSRANVGDGEAREHLYGDPVLYCARKRQISRREMKKYGLR